MSGLLAWWLTGMVLVRVDVPLVDALFQFLPFAVAFSAFAISGASNAVNIIDGFNGLSGGSVIIAVGALALLAFQVNDTEMFEICILVAAVTLGFLIVNFPFGKIFLGDGGAYLLGFLMGWLAIMLPMRNPDISVWATLLACAYPILETLFSIVRRRRRARSPGAADRLHLHSLVRRRILTYLWPDASQLALNSATGASMWIAAIVPATLATLWPSQSLILAICFALFALSYSAVYARLTQFRWCISPATLSLSHKHA
jgi:UDP-N-acetylmuramyl pentapeptide phosphotransferase/UDP-N-acetylglucosamine-1-phosphate transferase